MGAANSTLHPAVIGCHAGIKSLPHFCASLVRLQPEPGRWRGVMTFDRGVRRMPPRSVSVDKIAIVGTYLPQRCGIATFSSDLRTALSSAAPDTEVQVVAVKDGAHDYPSEVQF